MQIIAVAVGVLIAVLGWLVTQRQARQGTRRNMRIEYLLGAYRRLESASNRRMTVADDRDVEAAIADVMLLGSPEQVGLAESFVQAFAEHGQASTVPLLQALRGSLRQELLLEPVPPLRMWIRISPSTGARAWGESRIDRLWDSTSDDVRHALEREVPQDGLSTAVQSDFVEEMRELAASASPNAAIAASAQKVGRELQNLVDAREPDAATGLNLAQLAARAHELDVIDAALADTINGLSIMYMLAQIDQDKVDARRALEFAGYAAGILYMLKRTRRTGTGS